MTEQLVAPASYAQERLWLDCQLAPDLPLYTLFTVMKLDGALDADQATRAWATVVERHETLRTSLQFRDGNLMQVVSARLPVPQLPVSDLTGLGPDAVTREIDQLRRQETATPFALDQAPLWRARLARTDEGWLLLLAVHHTIYDAGSTEPLRAELTEAAAAVAQRRRPDLPELEIQYADHAAWQRAVVEGEAGQELLAHWRRRLAGAPAVHALPPDRPRPPELAYPGEDVFFHLPPGTCQRAEALGRRYGATELMVLFAAYAALLMEAGAGRDLVVGVPATGRDRAELRPLIGMFVNPLLVRVQAADDPPFTELLARVRDRMFEAWEHQDMPLQRLVTELAPAREPGVRPLYQLGFNHLKGFEPGRCHGVARDELMLLVADEQARLEYRTDLFDRATAQRLADGYLRTLERALADPDRRVSELAGVDGATSATSAAGADSAAPAASAATADPAAPAGPAAAGRRRYPLSFSQERLWVLDRLAPGDPVYNMPLAVRLRGRLDTRALQHALDTLVARHGTLRTTFAEADGEPVQLVGPPEQVPLPVEDLSAVAAADRVSVAREVVAAEGRAPFDLSTGPLLRAKLLRLADEDHFLLLTLHHIVADGWSLGVLAGELSELYRAHQAGEQPRLPELPIGYGDFARWQRQQLSAGEIDRQLAYWTEHLAGAPSLLELPTERPRPAVETFHGERHSFPLLPELAGGLARRCSEADATTFMGMLAALQVTLARYSGQTDIVVGTPVAGRSQPELEPLVGLFVNTLALRGQLAGNPTFRQLLAQARDATLAGLSNPDLPFEKLVEALQPERSLSHSPIFQVQLIVQNAPSRPLTLPGLTVTGEGLHSGTAKFDLTVEVQTLEDGSTRVSLEYNTDLFSQAWAQRFAGCLTSVLQAVIDNPDVRAFDIDLLPAGQRDEVVTAPNRTAAPLPAENLVGELVAALAGGSGGVTAAGTTTPLPEVGRWAARLATVLAGHGVAADVPVGLCLDRSAAMVAGMLGVWRAGGAYVPLDPAFPPERLRMMAADAGLPVIVTDRAQRRLAEQLAGPGTVVVNIEEPEVTGAAEQPAPAPVAGDALAYVIYTSGSTGRPKGVQVPHRPLVNLLHSFRRDVPLASTDTLVAVTTLSFDISVLELLLPLLTGARLVIATQEQSADPRALRRLLDESGATAMQATPATWRMLAASGGVPPELRVRLCGGEALPRDLADDLAADGAALWNVYGPTETTVWSAAGQVPASSELIEIGPPIANTQLYVLDYRLLPVPAGVVGEVCIGGAGVVRGYHARPDLTAERFVPDPFADQPGARMYRTGDLARRLPDGHLELLGRADNQVKVRGFRIETGEIETVLGEHPAVRQAVVTADTAAGDTRLVGYLVPASGGATPAELWSQLRPHLRSRLPDYMLPATLVVLPELPLTPNGKVDRRALPAPEWGVTSEVEFVAPRTEVEQGLAEVWAELLGVSGPIGVHHDFFSLGGHSLTATRLLARIRSQFGAQLSLREVFAGPTVAELAAAVVAHPDYGRPVSTPAAPSLSEVASSGVPADLRSLSDQDMDQLLEAMLRERQARQAVSSPQQYPLAPYQRRLWFLHQLDPDQPTYTVHGLRPLPGPVDAGAFTRAVGDLVRRHAALRTTFTEVDGEPAQVVAPTGEADCQVVDLSGQPPERAVELGNQALAEALREPFDLATGPLLRVRLVRLPDGAHTALLHLHHLVADESSVSILWRDLEQLYRQQASGVTAELPPLAVSYGEHAATLCEPDAQQRQREQVDYWRERLAGAPALLELPTDHPRPPVQTFRAGQHQFRIPAEDAAALRALARAQGATSLPLLLAAFQVLLARYSGQPDVLVGTPVTLRPTEELQHVVGLFVNTIVARADLSGNPTLAEHLAAVRSDFVGALGHAEVPFEQVVEALQPERSAAYPAVFQAMFVYNDAPRPARLGEGAAGELAGRLAAQLPAARFDLTLVVQPEGDALQGTLDYNADLFTEETIARMARHLRAVVAALASDPARPVWDLPLLSGDERRQLRDRGHRPREYPSQPVHEQVVAAAADQASALALLAGDERVSYGELEQRSRQLAHRLRELGVRADEPVGLALPASGDALVGLLGILRAGGAYLPLDPAHPAERLRWMLAQAGARLVVTTAAHADRLAGGEAETVLLELATGGAPRADELPEVHPDGTAYVIFTSGSTGVPNPVAVPHAAVANLTRAFVELHGFGPGDRLLMIPPLSFDASVGDIFPALTAGAALVLHPEPAGLAGKDLLRFCAEHRVTAVDAPSALWQQWVDELAGGQALPPDELSQVMVGGESVPLDKVRAWARVTGGQVRLVNHYGPTEAAVCATTHATVDGSEVGDRTQLPIGQPVPNVRCYVLDRRGALAPEGVPGELCLGGVAVARGYLGRPALTAERFVPDPFSDQPGARLYRTGDRARWVGDRLEFLGRTDAQVKVRGHRVEIGEVEAAVLTHPQVLQAAVVAAADGDGQGARSRLVAYVVPQPTAELAGGQLRDHLRERLPDYLVPTQVVLLEALPLTAHGKVDRAALPEPGEHRPPYQAPATATETALAGIWAEVLQLSHPVGRHDGFFDLGGHSLLAPAVMSRVRAVVGAPVPVRLLFQSGTLAELAELVDAHVAGGAAAGTDLRAAAVLPDDVCADLPPYQPRPLAQVLLTGATGFLGAFLLDDLLRHSQARVHCLVRADSVAAGAERIERNLRGYELWQPEYAGRIVPVPGDLSRPGLGLDPELAEQLARELDAVVHNGGVVSFLQPYEQLADANVAGTVEVLRLAGRHRPTPVHFVSTLGVFLSDAFRSGQVSEADQPDNPDGLRSGYNQSKWVADALVRQAAARGLPVTIHRPARITGDSRTGVSNPDDYFSRLLKTYVQLGSVPLWEGETDLAPVDHVSAAIGEAVRNPEALGGGYHYYNNQTISFDEIAVALRRAGLRVRRLPYPEWRAELLARVEQGEEIALAAFAPLLPEEEPASAEPAFDCSRAEQLARSAGAPCPPADGALLGRYLDYFLRTGYVTRPGEQAAASRVGG